MQNEMKPEYIEQIREMCILLNPKGINIDYFPTNFILNNGFTVQLAMTALFLLVSFSRKVTNKLINLIYKIMKKFKFIKNPENNEKC